MLSLLFLIFNLTFELFFLVCISFPRLNICMLSIDWSPSYSLSNCFGSKILISSTTTTGASVSFSLWCLSLLRGFFFSDLLLDGCWSVSLIFLLCSVFLWFRKDSFLLLIWEVCDSIEQVSYKYYINIYIYIIFFLNVWN